MISGVFLESPGSYILNPLMELIQSAIVVSCPAFIAEATEHEVDQIKATLTEQLLRCSDESLRWELQTALQYVTLRPFKYTFCRVVSLDSYLPFITISITFIAEATVYEVDQIKATLSEQLLRCSDESLRWELQTALQYVTLRPFKYTLCRAVPLNIYLPFATISLSITYRPSSYILNLLFEMVLLVLVVSCPAFIAEATVYEVDQIKAILTGQLLRCSDESLRWELQTALQYVTLRPFKFTLCRAVPLNIYLPFATISLSITYVIVILQLSHFSV
ncbi:hypothetical protein PYW07_008883 [Mythimna separata]|uniref:Gustatory receptor n=1 Tax=Mythimna separata TaxID=271217 RepID=A0AAD7YAI9_MYTSE|nr:hypothetical protein PYW07_008883 [Mythimna separata]